MRTASKSGRRPQFDPLEARTLLDGSSLLAEPFDRAADVGSLPTGWAQWSSAGTASYAVSEAQAFGSSGSLSSSGASNLTARSWPGMSMPSDVNVGASVFLGSLQPVQILGRGSNLGGSQPTYYAISATRGLNVNLLRVVGGVTTVLGSLSSPDYFSQKWARLTLDVSGSIVRAQVQRLDTGQYLAGNGRWQASPAWAISGIDTAITAGDRVGVARPATYAGPVYIDDFEVQAMPVSAFSAYANGPYAGREGSPVDLIATASGGVAPFSYAWDLDNNGTYETAGKAASSMFKDNGKYTVGLRVTDAVGQVAISTTTVAVSNVAPTPIPGGPYTAVAGKPLTVVGSATDPSPIDTAAGFSYAWDFGDGYTSTAASAGRVYAAPGTYTLALTVRDKDGGVATKTSTVTVAPASNAVRIDAAWLAQRGVGPYLLDQAGTTYILATDVTVPGTAFVAAAKDVTLDLNGHTITYDQSAPIVVRNGGFEEGNGPADVPGWDLSQAPTARRVAARVGMWGDWMLRLENITTPQVIQSALISIPEAGREYAAAITPKGPSGTTVRLSVVDAVTGAILASGTSRDPNRGFSPVVQFTPTTTNAVQIRVEVTPPAGKVATVDLDYASLTRSRNYGVVGTYASWNLPGHLQTDATFTALKAVANFTLKNGTIRQGSGRSFAGSPIFARTARGITIDGVTAVASGMDTNHVEAVYADDVTVRGSRLVGELDRLSNRMLLFAGIQLSGTTGRISITDNTIEGLMHTGVHITRSAQEVDPVTIRGNQIRIDTLGTDGYGIVINGLRNFEIAGNTIVSINGRGILVDGYSSGVSRDGVIRDNYVEARERPNLEYDATALEATALRMRNYGGAHLNLRIVNNTFAAYTGPGQAWAAIGARITASNTSGQMTGANNLFENNTFKAIVTAPDPNLTGIRASRAWGLSLSGADAGTGITFRGNRIESNDVSLNFGDNDGYAAAVEDLTFVSNTIRKSSEGAALPYQGIVAGDWRAIPRNIRLIDMRYENGALPGVRFLYTAAKDVSIGWLLDVAVTDPSGAPAAGVEVRLRDKDGREIFCGITDDQGRIRGIAVITTVMRQTTADPNAIQTDTRGPFTIEALSAAGRALQTFEMGSNFGLALRLS